MIEVGVNNAGCARRACLGWRSPEGLVWTPDESMHRKGTSEVLRGEVPFTLNQRRSWLSVVLSGLFRRSVWTLCV